MKKFRIGYDDNLGLPMGFSQALDCETVSYHELGDLIQAFKQREVEIIFIPVGTLPYIKEYEMISQAILSEKPQSILTSTFVTTYPLTIQDIPKHTLGRVNQYCTTSYWAPLIYLMDFLPKHSTLHFQDTNGFQDMLFKTADKTVDASMVWDIFLKQNPDATKKVHALFSLNTLPAPVLVSASKLPTEISEKLNTFKSKETKTLFNAFQKPDLPNIKKFLASIKAAQDFYSISINPL